MCLRESRFRGLLDLMLNRIDPTFAALVQASFELVDSFFKLHADGLCYRDSTLRHSPSSTRSSGSIKPAVKARVNVSRPNCG